MRYFKIVLVILSVMFLFSACEHTQTFDGTVSIGFESDTVRFNYANTFENIPIQFEGNSNVWPISVSVEVVSDYDENGQRKLYVETRLKTNSTRRTLPLIPHIERMLLKKKELEAHFKKICGSSYDKEFEGFICRDNYGKLISPEYVTSRFHYVITKAGLRHLRFHDLRHSCASLLLANDVPMKAIQEWLGHSNYAITANLYSHLEYNAKVISAETIARVLDGEAEQQSKATLETAEPEKKSTKKKTASKKTAAKTTDTSAPKKTGGRKKKSDTPAVTGESQSSRL